MKYIFELILMEMSSAIMYFAAQILYRNMQKKNARWYYAMLVTAMLMLILPLQRLLNVPKMMSVTISEDIVSVVPVTAVTKATLTVSQLVFVLWVAVAIAMAVFTAVKYYRTRRAILGNSTRVTDAEVLAAYGSVAREMGIRRKIDLRVSDKFRSPMLFGIINPVVILPDTEFSQKELIMIMSHELTHYRHCDLVIKLISSISVCVHWFNPVAYMLSKSLNGACELCCDESVLERLELEDKKDYGRLIISVIETSLNRKLSYTTAMAATENGLKRRLRKIAEFSRPSVAMRIVGVMLVVSISVTSLTAFGIDFAKKALPEETVKVIEEIEDTPILGEVTAPATPEPQSTPYEAAVIGTPSPRRISMPTTASLPMVTPATQTPRPTADAPQRTQTPSEPDRDTSVNIQIESSVNFNGKPITSSDKKQIATKSETEIKDGEKVTAYIRVNDDGTYDLMYTQKEE